MMPSTSEVPAEPHLPTQKPVGDTCREPAFVAELLSENELLVLAALSLDPMLERALKHEARTLERLMTIINALHVIYSSSFMPRTTIVDCDRLVHVWNSSVPGRTELAVGFTQAYDFLTACADQHRTDAIGGGLRLPSLDLSFGQIATLVDLTNQFVCSDDIHAFLADAREWNTAMFVDMLADREVAQVLLTGDGKASRRFLGLFDFISWSVDYWETVESWREQGAKDQARALEGAFQYWFLQSGPFSLIEEIAQNARRQVLEQLGSDDLEFRDVARACLDDLDGALTCIRAATESAVAMRQDEFYRGFSEQPEQEKERLEQTEEVREQAKGGEQSRALGVVEKRPEEVKKEREQWLE